MTPRLQHSRYTFRHLVIYGLATLGILCFISYILFQARFIIEGPIITFADTADTSQSERVVHISGISRNIVSLTLNGREIYTDKSGYFNEALVLENGYTVATITARDRYGRERSYEQSFVYTGAQPNLTNNYGNKENDQESS